MPLMYKYFACLCVCVFSYLYRAMAQVVSWRPITAETRLQSQASLFRVRVCKVALRQGFSPDISVFPCQCHLCATHTVRTALDTDGVFKEATSKLP
jgi:hypothetical protein